MKILQNKAFIDRQSDTLIRSEMSNVSAVLANQPTLVTYYSINADLTTLMPGVKDVESYLGEESTVTYDRIENLPIMGIENLVADIEYDDEQGYKEEYESSGLILPNTITPKPHDRFVITTVNGVAVYKVTEFRMVSARSNPYIQVMFKYNGNARSKVEALDRQVNKGFETTVTSLGGDTTLVVEKSALLDIKTHIKSYVELTNLYSGLFYNRRYSTFLYRKSPDSPIICDAVLWQFMIDSGVVIYDNVITYAINNLNMSIQRIYTDTPDILVPQYEYQQSAYVKFTLGNTGKPIENINPVFYSHDVQRSKFDGPKTVFVESYSPTKPSNIFTMGDNVWSEDFTDRLLSNCPIGDCSVKDALIRWYNGSEVAWDDINIEPERTLYNYQLLPLLLFGYKQYITGLQNS